MFIKGYEIKIWLIILFLYIGLIESLDKGLKGKKKNKVIVSNCIWYMFFKWVCCSLIFLGKMFVC